MSAKLLLDSILFWVLIRQTNSLRNTMNPRPLDRTDRGPEAAGWAAPDEGKPPGAGSANGPAPARGATERACVPARRSALYGAVRPGTPPRPEGAGLVRLKTLGELSLWRGTEPVAAGEAPPYALHCLAILALAGDRAVSSDDVIALLWP